MAYGGPLAYWLCEPKRGPNSPQNSGDDDSDDSTSVTEVEPTSTRRLSGTWWCLCGECVDDLPEKDCVCCREIPLCLKKIGEDGI